MREPLKEYFQERIKLPNYQKETKIYITNIFVDPKIDLLNQSITLYYSEALDQNNFEKFQQLGDWILLAKTLFPKTLNDASNDYYYTIAQLSYYKCHKMLRKQWLLYEELADKFPQLIPKLRGFLRAEKQAFLKQSLLIQI